MSLPVAHSKEHVSLGKTHKIPKACEACRQKKQRCDGQRPCSACTKRDTPCSYRAITRHRGRKPLSSTLNAATIWDSQSTATTISRAASVEDNPSIPGRVHIFNNIRASHEPSGTETFYGASSTISLLLHIDDQLHNQSQPADNSTRHMIEDQDGTEGIKRYNYQSIAFGMPPQPIRRSVQCLFLSHDSAKIFLRNFLVSWINRMPFLEPEKLCVSLDKLYIEDSGAPLIPVEKSILIIALAIGATPSSDTPGQQYLVAQAHTEAESMMYDVSLRAVQISLLMAQCEFDNGNSNMCYLQLGSAIRKAFASGIHRMSRPEAKKTMWTLFCNETLICVKLGRPYSLTEADVPSLDSGDPGYFGFFVRLCIIIRSTYNIYCHKDSSVAVDLAQADSIHKKVQDFSSQIRGGMGLEIGAQIYALEGERLFWHVSISYLYHFSIMLVYRPFLVLHVECERRLAFYGINANTVNLSDATSRCIQSARSIILLSESIFSLGIKTEAIHHHLYYLESACFVVVLAASQKNASSAGFVELVKTGLKLLQRLPPREPIVSVVSAIEQMLERLSTLSNIHAGGSHSTSSISIGPQNEILATDPMAAAGYPMGLVDQDFITLYNDGEALEDLWSTIDWDVAFPSLGLGIPNIPATF